MSKPAELLDSIRFGDDFELDVRAYQLRSAGIPVKLKPTQMEILRLLIEHRGELVTREQIVERIWGKGVFLDTDNSINAAISRIRQVLRDNVEQPRFVETVTGRGYRFIATPVEGRLATTLTEPNGAPGEFLESSNEPKSVKETIPPLAPSRPRVYVVAISLLLVVSVGLAVWRFRSKAQPTTSNGRVMLAVLPFENLTGDAAQDYFSEGMTEEMITQLGRLDFQQIGVIGRTSVMRYKNNPKPLDRIGRELGVQYVLEGSVRHDAGRVRITAQLIQTKDQTHVWAQEYDRDLKDLLVVQGEIARKISEEIQAALGGRKPFGQAPQAAITPVNYEAYELYLKGQYFWNKRTTEGFERAIDYFQQAIAKDPNYARAYAGLADSYVLMGGYSIAPQTHFMPKARAAALRAIELDESLPEAHTAWALIVQNNDWDWQTAEKEYRRAIELNPNYATAHHWYAEHLAISGRFDDALRESEQARQLDPLSLIIAADNGVILYYSRQYDRAIEQFHSVREMDPNFPRSGMIRQVYAQKGMFAEILSEDDKMQRTYGDAPWIWSERAYVYGRTGQQERARQALAKTEDWNRHHPIDLAMFVAPYIGMGDKDQAFVWLEKAYAQHSTAMVALKVDPLYDPLRSDPRFQDLLRRVGLAQ